MINIDNILYMDDDIRYIDIPGIKANYYKITRDGKIFNNKGLLMKPFLSNTGYLRINLSTGFGKQRKYNIHRLVALTFIKNDDPEKYIVNHIDGNKLNNDKDNLEWSTLSLNNLHAYDNNLAYTKGEKCHLSNPDKYPDELIHSICKLLEQGMTSPEIILELKLCKKVDYKNKDYNRYRHYINDLRNRNQRRDITKLYAF